MQFLRRNFKIVVVIGSSVTIILIIMYVVFFQRERGYESAVENNFIYLEECDYKKLMTLGKPRKVAEAMSESIHNKDLDECAEIMDPVYEVFWEAVKAEGIAGEIRIANKIWEAEPLDQLDKLKDEVIWDFEDFVYEMDKLYEKYGFEADKIQKAYAVEVRFILMKNEVSTGIDETTVMTVYEYEDNWYIYESDIVDIFFFVNEIPYNRRIHDKFYEAYDEAVAKLLED